MEVHCDDWFVIKNPDSTYKTFMVELAFLTTLPSNQIIMLT